MKRITKKWEHEETSLLIEEFPKVDKIKLMQLFPDRSMASVVIKASELGLRTNLENHIRTWKTNEINLLEKVYCTAFTKDLKNFFPNRTKNSINLKAQSLGLVKNNSIYRNTLLDKLLNDTEEAYYWIGFILADGHISNSRLNVTLAKKDKKHLEKLSEYINSPIRDLEKSNACVVSCRNVDVVPQIIKKFDMHEGKTYNPPNIDIFYKMSDEHFLSCLVGYIDGDGNIKKNKNRKDYNIRIKCHKSWTSVYEYFKKRVEEIMNMEFNNTVNISKERYCQLVFSSSKQIKFLKQKALELDIPILHRKWDIIQEGGGALCQK